MPAPIVYAVITVATLAAKLLNIKKITPKKIKEDKEKSDKCVDNGGVQKCLNNKKIPKKIKGIQCFKPGDAVKASFKKRHPTGKTREGRDLDQEFDRQLLNQQDGINAMSPEDLIEGIEKYKGVRNPKKAKIVKEKYRTKIFKKKRAELKKSHPKASTEEKKKLKKKAEQYADNAAKQVDVLHNPDGLAGGKDEFKNKNIDKHIGDKGINRSLGSQWRHAERTEALKKEAEKALKNGDKTMNTQLKRC